MSIMALNDAALLERCLHRTTGSADLARRAVVYVLSGQDPGVVGAIDRIPIFSRSSMRNSAPLIKHEEVCELLPSLVALEDPAVLVRFGRVRVATETTRPFHEKTHVWPEAPWLEAWLSTISSYYQSHLRGLPALMNAGHLVAMLESEKLSAELLVRAALETKPVRQGYVERRFVETLARIPGYGEVLARHAALIRAWLPKADAIERVGFLELMQKCECDAEPFIAELIDFATGSAKTVREAAEPALHRAKTLARPELERLAREGDAGRRAQAFRLLAAFYPDDAGEFLKGFEREKLPETAREAFEKALARTLHDERHPAEPTAHAIQTIVPLPESAREAFRQMIEVQSLHASKLRGSPARLDAGEIEHLIGLLETLIVPPGEEAPVWLLGLMDEVAFSSCARFMETAEIRLIHVVRLLLLNRGIQGLAKQPEFPHCLGPAGVLLRRFRQRESFDLRHLGRVFEAVGIDERAIIWSMRHPFGECFLDWEPEQVGPFLLDHVPLLERLLRERPSSAWESPAAPFYRMLAHLTEIPPSLVEGLWRLATGATAERDQARQILEKLTDLEARMRRALGGSAAGVRSIVALWFAERGSRSAIPVLREALEAEKQEPVRKAIVIALERLGAPVETPVDRERVLFESAAVVKKGIPPALDWFPVDALPRIHWADSGEPVESVILKRLLIENHKLRSPEPSPVLRRICAEFQADDRDALGQLVLDTWIARDLADKAPQPVPLTPARIAQITAVQAIAQKWLAQNPQFAKFAKIIPPQQMAAAAPFHNPTSSATKDKGILALTSACASESAVPKIAAYLKEWYGYRPAQCKALLGILPWLPVPSATQLLLATARRFRTRTIQEEAERLSREMAQRRGWTMDQLGDRTIPDAGFAHDGALQLPLGKRTLTLRLTPQLTTELVTAEGKLLKSFPNASAQDDEELYKTAKADFVSARSTVKTVAAQQTQRLYEAFCAEREWTFSELREFLLEHPIAGSLCRRLVWQSADRTFRPLGDGTLTDVHDGQVEIDGAAEIRLAYCPADAEVWRRHLADYEVAPLFPQLDRPLHVPADLTAGELADFRGYAVGFFRLNNLVTKFGYRHAPVVDGPAFSSYLKRIPGLNLDLELSFSGMQMPPVDETVFLMDLKFSRDYQPVSLTEVPRVLLSECWHDLKTIADAGTGYDPDWESKMH